MTSAEDESVLARLGPMTWSQDDGVTYEVAIEGINQVIGAYSALIGRERAAAAPDTTAIESLRAARGEWAHTRKTLSPTDRAGVDRVSAECAELLIELRARRGA